MFRRRFKRFGEKIEKNLDGTKTIGVCYDSDADGVCATALLTIYLLDKFKKYPDNLVSCFHDVDKKLENMKDDIIFILDTSPKKIDEHNLIIIDHHVVQNVPKNALFFNPRMFDKSLYIATSYLVYKILDLPEDACWIASTGIKADKSENSCQDVLKQTYKKFPEFKKMERRLIGLTSTSKNISNASIIVNSLIECYNMGSPSFFGKTPSSSKLIRISKQVHTESLKNLLNAKRLMETNKILLYTINSDFNIQGLIANKIFKLNPEKTIVVCNSKLNEELIHLEVRTDKKSMYKKFLKKLEKVVEDIGGHENAFGLSLQKDKFDEFLRILSGF